MAPNISGAQERNSNPAPSLAAHAGADRAQDGKLQALQAEVQVMKDFTEHILSTVYFALGTVVVVLIAMVGFGWYQNFRVFERDKEALRQSLLGTLKEETVTGFEALDSKATERFKSFDASIANALERTHQRLADVQLMSRRRYSMRHTRQRHRARTSWSSSISLMRALASLARVCLTTHFLLSLTGCKTPHGSIHQRAHTC